LLSAINVNKWVCSGDYNGAPNDMTAKGYQPVASTSATQTTSMNTLDFAIGKKVTITLLIDDGALMSDHFSQHFEVQ
jgi:hypothetical protein